VILSDRTIREELDAGRIEIDPLLPNSIQPSSVDLHVDRYFRVFRNHTMSHIDVKQNLEDLTELVEIGQDDRFMLFAKSKLPWDYWWIWRKPEEQEHYAEVFRRIQTSPHLRGAVVFDDFGGDVPAWLRRIGWVLSTSDDESFHLAPAEGMASRAVPALLPWPGSDSIYHPRWIDDDVDAMAERILTVVHDGRWEAEGRTAHRHLLESFPLDAVCAAWTRLLVEDASPESALGTLAPTS